MIIISAGQLELGARFSFANDTVKFGGCLFGFAPLVSV